MVFIADKEREREGQKQKNIINIIIKRKKHKVNKKEGQKDCVPVQVAPRVIGTTVMPAVSSESCRWTGRASGASSLSIGDRYRYRPFSPRFCSETDGRVAVSSTVFLFISASRHSRTRDKKSRIRSESPMTYRFHRKIMFAPSTSNNVPWSKVSLRSRCTYTILSSIPSAINNRTRCFSISRCKINLKR